MGKTFPQGSCKVHSLEGRKSREAHGQECFTEHWSFNVRVNFALPIQKCLSLREHMGLSVPLGVF